MGVEMTLAGWFWLSQYDEAEIDLYLDRAVRAGMIRVIPYIGAGTVFFQSELLPQAQTETLMMIVQKADSLGLEVEPYWAVGSTARNSLFREWYPDFTVALDANVPDTCHWLNFSLPDARQLVTNVVVAMAQRGVNAIQLDTIRYPYQDPFAPAGCAGFDCRTVFSESDVSSTVQLAYNQLKAVMPDIELTCAVHPGQGGPESCLQYWKEWLAGGFVDRVYPMAYVENPENLSWLDDYLEYWGTMSNQDRIHCGLIVHNGSGASKVAKTPEQLQTEIETIEAGGFTNFAMFNIRELTEPQIEFLEAHFMTEVPEHPRSALDILNDIKLGNESSKSELSMVKASADSLTADVATLTDRYTAQELLIAELEAYLVSEASDLVG